MMSDRFTLGWNGERHKGLRYGTLWCSREDLDGEVTLSVHFDGEDDIAKHDLLDDWIGLLTRERDALHERMYPAGSPKED